MNLPAIPLFGLNFSHHYISLWLMASSPLSADEAELALADFKEFLHILSVKCPDPKVCFFLYSIFHGVTRLS